MARIAVIGVCCSRDPVRLTPHTVSAFASLVTWPGLASKPMKVGDNWFEGTRHSDFLKRCVKEDFEKTWFERVLAEPFDWLLIDLLSERRVLKRVGDTLVFPNFAVTSTPRVAALLEEAEDLVDEGPLPLDLWADLAAPSLARLRARVSPERIILNRVVPGLGYRQPDGSIKPCPEDRTGEFARQAEKLPAIYDHFAEELPGCRQIRVSQDLMVSDPHHAWGRAPFHYEKAYEEAVADALMAITEEKAPGEAMAHHQGG